MTSPSMKFFCSRASQLNYGGSISWNTWVPIKLKLVKNFKKYTTNNLYNI